MLESDSTKDQQGIRGESLMTEQGNTEGMGQPLIEVGEVAGDGLRLWCARLALEHAKDEAVRLDAAVQKVKNRANNLLGWSVTLTAALIALMFTHLTLMIPLSLMALLLFSVSLLCVKILSPIPWTYTYVTLKRLYECQETLSTELEITEGLVNEYQTDNDRNALEYYKIQTFMKWAWMIFMTVPVTLFTISLEIYFMS